MKKFFAEFATEIWLVDNDGEIDRSHGVHGDELHQSHHRWSNAAEVPCISRTTKKMYAVNTKVPPNLCFFCVALIQQGTGALFLCHDLPNTFLGRLTKESCIAAQKARRMGEMQRAPVSKAIGESEEVRWDGTSWSEKEASGQVHGC